MNDEIKKTSRDIFEKAMGAATQVAQSAKEEYQKSDIKNTVEEISGKFKSYVTEAQSKRLQELEEKIACQSEKNEILEIKLKKANDRIDELESKLDTDKK